jgi:DNA-binding PadR family transcriptional regulator
VQSRWETIDPVAQGRPNRRYYRLTGQGAAEARAEVKAMQEQMDRAIAPARRARPA